MTSFNTYSRRALIAKYSDMPDYRFSLARTNPHQAANARTKSAKMAVDGRAVSEHRRCSASGRGPKKGDPVPQFKPSACFAVPHVPFLALANHVPGAATNPP